MTGGFASEDPVCCMGSLNENWNACTAASLGLECGSGKGPRTWKTGYVDHLTSSFLLLYCKVLHMITYWKTVWHCLHRIVRVGCSSWTTNWIMQAICALLHNNWFTSLWQQVCNHSCAHLASWRSHSHASVGVDHVPCETINELLNVPLHMWWSEYVWHAVCDVFALWECVHCGLVTRLQIVIHLNCWHMFFKGRGGNMCCVLRECVLCIWCQLEFLQSYDATHLQHLPCG